MKPEPITDQWWDGFKVGWIAGALGVGVGIMIALGLL